MECTGEQRRGEEGSAEQPVEGKAEQRSLEQGKGQSKSRALKDSEQSRAEE